MASTTSVGMPIIRWYTLVAPPGRQVSTVRGPREPVGDLVDGAVAAERAHDVVALLGGVARELGRVVAALGLADVDVEAALERVDDELLQPGRGRRRVRVDDDAHPPRRRRGATRRRPAARGRERGPRQPSLVGNTTTSAASRAARAGTVGAMIAAVTAVALDGIRAAAPSGVEVRPLAGGPGAATFVVPAGGDDLEAIAASRTVAGGPDAVGRDRLDGAAPAAAGDALRRARRARHPRRGVGRRRRCSARSTGSSAPRTCGPGTTRPPRELHALRGADRRLRLDRPRRRGAAGAVRRDG